MKRLIDDRAGMPMPESSGRDAFGLAVILAVLAGWVDVTGYLRFHGLFVSFMSGNSTVTVAALGIDDIKAARAALAVVMFIVGVVLGESIAPPGTRWGRPLVLAIEAALLWAAVAAHGAGEPVVASLLGLAMGLQNASVHHAGGVAVAVTYFTGVLVHIGRSVSEALRGISPWRQAAPFLALWLGLIGGGLAGAATARWSSVAAIGVAALTASVLATWTALSVRRLPPASR